ncbi:small subunit ribosomal protein S20e [Pancytospora epiphaga]|nr:small subunit ribosomal protein S20e [Pancytospora epiphaga]
MESVLVDKKEDIPTEHLGSLKKISVTLRGMDNKVMNRIAREFFEFVKKYDDMIALPVILPIQEASFTTRKSPCGNGTATFSRVRLRVYQRKFSLNIYDRDTAAVVDFLKGLPVDVQFKSGQ